MLSGALAENVTLTAGSHGYEPEAVTLAPAELLLAGESSVMGPAAPPPEPTVTTAAAVAGVVPAAPVQVSV